MDTAVGHRDIGAGRSRLDAPHLGRGQLTVSGSVPPKRVPLLNVSVPRSR